MDIETLVIESQAETAKASKTLRASLLHVLSMPTLMGYSDRSPNLPLRPAMISFAAPDNECRSFAAGARATKRIEARNQAGTKECEIELLKGDGYRAAVNRMVDGATAITLFSTQVFGLEARPSDEVAFGMAVPTHWVDGMAKSLAAAGGLGKIPMREAAVAMWFVAYLDRRCRTPLLATPEFSWLLWKSALDRKFAAYAATGDRKKAGTWVNPSPPIGLDVVASVKADTEEIEDWIAGETKSYMQKGGREVVEGMLREAAERVKAQEATLFEVREQEEEEERVRAMMPERTGVRRVDGEAGVAGHRGAVVPGADQVRDQLGLFGEVAL